MVLLRELTHFACASFWAMIGYGLPQVREDAGPLRGPEEEKAGAHDALRVRLLRAHDREGSSQAPGGTDTVAPGEALLTLAAPRIEVPAQRIVPSAQTAHLPRMAHVG